VKYLLDTCVLSELVKAIPDCNVIAWINAQTEESMFISSITLAELLKGIARLLDSHRKMALTEWVSKIREEMADRTLPFDSSTAEYWASMCATAEKSGTTLSAFDSMIAATAREHGLVIATRNTRDFKATEVMLINPWLE
jgi:toxin FitB